MPVDASSRLFAHRSDRTCSYVEQMCRHCEIVLSVFVCFFNIDLRILFVIRRRRVICALVQPNRNYSW